MIQGTDNAIARLSLKNSLEQLSALDLYQQGVTTYMNGVSEISDGSVELHDGLVLKLKKVVPTDVLKNRE